MRPLCAGCEAVADTGHDSRNAASRPPGSDSGPGYGVDDVRCEPRSTSTRTLVGQWCVSEEGLDTRLSHNRCIRMCMRSKALGTQGIRQRRRRVGPGPGIATQPMANAWLGVPMGLSPNWVQVLPVPRKRRPRGGRKPRHCLSVRRSASCSGDLELLIPEVDDELQGSSERGDPRLGDAFVRAVRPGQARAPAPGEPRAGEALAVVWAGFCAHPDRLFLDRTKSRWTVPDHD